VYVAPGQTEEQAFRLAFEAEHQALQSVDRPIAFSECAASVFLGKPDRYTVIGWGKGLGQVFRQGTDIDNFHASNPDRPRFHSVLWNYAYTLPIGRFQAPGYWADPDFLIAGDGGMSLAESRSQMALWSMMSAPLILSSDLARLTSEALAIVGNQVVIAIDQDPMGQMATLVARSPETDVLFKRLADGAAAVAVLNRSEAPVKVDLRPADFGFAAGAKCTLDAKDLWNGQERASVSTLHAEVASHDTIIWRIQASSQCGKPSRTGTVTLTNEVKNRPFNIHTIDGYVRCLTAPGTVGECTGAASQSWTFTPQGELRSGDQCMSVVDGKPLLTACSQQNAQDWRYTLEGNLMNNGNSQCLTAAGSGNEPQSLRMEVCGHNLATQIWSLPN
jgi:alpha-galactosidase